MLVLQQQALFVTHAISQIHRHRISLLAHSPSVQYQ
jgi:hypothetical protein